MNVNMSKCFLELIMTVGNNVLRVIAIPKRLTYYILHRLSASEVSTPMCRCADCAAPTVCFSCTERWRCV